MWQPSGLLDAPLNMPFSKTMALAHCEIWEQWFPLFRPFSSSIKWIGWLKTLLISKILGLYMHDFGEVYISLRLYDHGTSPAGRRKCGQLFGIKSSVLDLKPFTPSHRLLLRVFWLSNTQTIVKYFHQKPWKKHHRDRKKEKPNITSWRWCLQCQTFRIHLEHRVAIPCFHDLFRLSRMLAA